MEINIILSISLVCWAIYGATGEFDIAYPIIERFPFLDKNIISSCPKCMPTLYTIPVCLFINYTGIYEINFQEVPLYWLCSSGLNSLFIYLKS